MTFFCGAAFVESLIDDLKNDRDCWIIYQNVKWNVLKVSDVPCGRDFWGDLYEVEIDLRKDIEQLSLFPEV